MMATPLTIPIFYALLALPPAYGEAESVSAREVRLATVAVAIDEATDGDDELSAALVTEAWHETRLSRRVHEMGPRKDTSGYAISLWSLHSWNLVPYSEWVMLGGLSGTAPAAEAAARVLRFAKDRCRSWPGAFALYATGKRCSWKGAAGRAYTFRRVLGWIRSTEGQT